jgi:hypothetical protein
MTMEVLFVFSMAGHLHDHGGALHHRHGREKIITVCTAGEYSGPALPEKVEHGPAQALGCHRHLRPGRSAWSSAWIRRSCQPWPPAHHQHGREKIITGMAGKINAVLGIDAPGGDQPLKNGIQGRPEKKHAKKSNFEKVYPKQKQATD